MTGSDDSHFHDIMMCSMSESHKIQGCRIFIVQYLVGLQHSCGIMWHPAVFLQYPVVFLRCPAVSCTFQTYQ